MNRRLVLLFSSFLMIAVSLQAQDPAQMPPANPPKNSLYQKGVTITNATLTALPNNPSRMHIGQSEAKPATELPDTTPCCGALLEKVKTATGVASIQGSEVSVLIDTSLNGKHTTTAGLFDCSPRGDGSYEGCHIYVTDKLKKRINNNELALVLAHELGHIPGLGNTPTLQDELAIDKAAAMTVDKLGIPGRQVLISTLQKCLNEPFEGKENLDQMLERKAHAENLPAGK